MMDGSYTPDTLTHEQRIRNFNINFGPQHPAAHGVLRLVLELVMARSWNAAIRISALLPPWATEKADGIAQLTCKNLPYFDPAWITWPR